MSVKSAGYLAEFFSRRCRTSPVIAAAMPRPNQLKKAAQKPPPMSPIGTSSCEAVSLLRSGSIEGRGAGDECQPCNGLGWARIENVCPDARAKSLPA